MLISILLLILFVLSFIGFLRIINFYYFQKDLKYNKRKPKSISIIIPARNEEKRIEKLLRSIPKVEILEEVLVVDDNSTDNTESISRKYGAKVLKVMDFYLEKGGKSIACYVGAINSKGEYLLFIDADVFFEDSAFKYILENIPEEGALTIMPYHQTEKFYEQFSLYSNLIALLGIEIGKFSNPLGVGNGYFGPFFLIKREDYFKVGGHKSVEDSIIEDIMLGKKLVRAGIKIYSIPHKKLIKFRMYPEGLKSLFMGWAKNMASGATNTSLFCVMIITSILSLSFIIPTKLAEGIINLNALSIALYSLLYMIYSTALYICARSIGSFGFLTCLLFPIFSSFYFAIFFSSVVIKLFKLRINWRGRLIKVK
jgi:4,4'-diaponeurosporenoate glycosyltransferase